MKCLKISTWIVFLLAIGAARQMTAQVTITCDSGIQPAVCTYLQNTTAALYNNSFTNATVSLYVRYNPTASVVGGANSLKYVFGLTYSSYSGSLTTASSASNNPIQKSAVSALTAVDAPVYGTASMGGITAPMLYAFKISAVGALSGLTSAGSACATGTFAGQTGCYDGVVTMGNNSTSASGFSWFFRGVGGTPTTEASNQADFFTTFEHELDELLGTSSCVSTINGVLSNCTTPAPVDLFRYQQANGAPSAKNLVLVSTTPGAYFSYDGGNTNGANGNIYNTLANGADYADFASTTPCQYILSIQGAYQCNGQDGYSDITTDGGAEMNILNAVGFALSTKTAASLSITAAHSPASIPQGAPGTITLTVTNTGGVTGSAAVVTDTIDSSFTINSASAGCSVSGQVVTCTVPAGSAFTARPFTVYVTAKSTAVNWNNKPTLTSGDTVANNTTNDSVTVILPLTNQNANLMQTALSGSTMNGTCAGTGNGQGNRTIAVTASLGNVGASLATLNNPYATNISLTNGNTLLAQFAPASIPSTNVLPFNFIVQMTNCNTFKLNFDVYSN